MIPLNTYEELLQDADDEQVHVHESVDLNGDSTGEKRLNGLYVDGHIALDSQLKTTAEKTSILAEEMGHHFTSVGDITDLKNVNSRQQELDARLWGYNRLIGRAVLSVLLNITARTAMRWQNIWMLRKIISKNPWPVTEANTAFIPLLITMRFTLFPI